MGVQDYPDTQALTKDLTEHIHTEQILADLSECIKTKEPQTVEEVVHQSADKIHTKRRRNKAQTKRKERKKDRYLNLTQFV